jgi:hypothetical protein
MPVSAGPVIRCSVCYLASVPLLRLAQRARRATPPRPRHLKRKVLERQATEVAHRGEVSPVAGLEHRRRHEDAVASSGLQAGGDIDRRTEWTGSPARASTSSTRSRRARWHHSSDKPAIDTNYAVHLPLWDKLFGTFHMPGEHWPAEYGTTKRLPRTFVGQVLFPFKGGK